jgi:phospholipid/cholesterol/gamma-HCH transport system substrate-binding protein
MSNSAAEAAIGAVVLAAAAAFAVYAAQSSGAALGHGTKPLVATFGSVEGISVGTDVRLAGIRVGSVTALDLDPASFQATAAFTVREDLELPEDTDVSIASEGLLGGAYLELTPGGSDFMLEPGDEIVNTKAAESLINLLMRYGVIR